MQRVAIYARQSGNTSDGIPRQLAKCRELLAKRGWTATAVFTDNFVSATARRGPKTQWSKLLTALENDEFDVVVAVNLDRLLRSLRDMAVLIDLGAKIVTVDGQIDLTTAEGAFQASVLASIAAFEVTRKSERFLRAHQFQVSQGVPVMGTRKFGFEPDMVTKRADEAEWIVRIFERTAEGETFTSTARLLNRARVAPAPPHEVWTWMMVSRKVRNPRYRGRVPYLNASLPSDVMPQFVSPELIASVDAVLADQSHISTGRAPSLLSLIAVCSTCGSVMGASGTHRISKPLGLRYSCTFSQRHGDDRAHPSIARLFADAIARHAVVSAFIYGQRLIDELPGVTHELRHVEEQLGLAHSKKQALLTQFRNSPGEPSLDIGRSLQGLAQRIHNLRAHRARILTSGLYRAVLNDVRPSLRSASLSTAEGEALRESIGRNFDRLRIDQKRILVSTLINVTIDNGYGGNRVRIHHKVVPDLNLPDAPRLVFINRRRGSTLDYRVNGAYENGYDRGS